jgi:hypothetical protein
VPITKEQLITRELLNYKENGDSLNNYSKWIEYMRKEANESKVFYFKFNFLESCSIVIWIFNFM